MLNYKIWVHSTNKLRDQMLQSSNYSHICAATLFTAVHYTFCLIYVQVSGKALVPVATGPLPKYVWNGWEVRCLAWWPFSKGFPSFSHASLAALNTYTSTFRTNFPQCWPTTQYPQQPILKKNSDKLWQTLLQLEETSSQTPDSNLYFIQD